MPPPGRVPAMRMSEPLPPSFAAALEATRPRRGRFGEPIYFFPETGSTNTVAATLADGGAADGTTVVALAQTAGRGRFGREWFSPAASGIYASVICRNARAAPFLTLAGGVAVAEGIRRASGLPVQIKWPNDIVVEQGTGSARRRKLAGILAEASSGAEGLQYVVLGFGVNVACAAYPPSLGDRASSVEAELGRPVDPGAILAETLAALAQACDDLERDRGALVLERWRALAPSAEGTIVEWDTTAGPLSGTSAGIDDDGALLVRRGDRVERIISGELRWGFKPCF